MADPTGWRILVRKWSWLRQIFDVAGGTAGWILAAIAGLSIVTAILGFFTEHPSVAIALSVIVAYYGFRLFERAHLWWRRESVDTKLLIEPLLSRVVAQDNATGVCTVSIVYKITNNAPFDVLYVEDDDDFWVGPVHAEATPRMPVDILPPGRELFGAASVKIPANTYDQSYGKITFRCGKNRNAMNVRRFFAFEQSLPRQIALTKDLQDGFRIIRNETEWIME